MPRKGAARRPAVTFEPLLVFVQPGSERARQALRQDYSFAKKQESPPALLVVVPSDCLRGAFRDARIR